MLFLSYFTKLYQTMVTTPYTRRCIKGVTFDARPALLQACVRAYAFQRSQRSSIMQEYGT